MLIGFELDGVRLIISYVARLITMVEIFSFSQVDSLERNISRKFLVQEGKEILPACGRRFNHRIALSGARASWSASTVGVLGIV